MIKRADVDGFAAAIVADYSAAGAVSWPLVLFRAASGADCAAAVVALVAALVLMVGWSEARSAHVKQAVATLIHAVTTLPCRAVTASGKAQSTERL